MDLFRVAVVQAGSVPFDRKRSTMKDSARLAVPQYLGWRGINPVWVSSGYVSRERLEFVTPEKSNALTIHDHHFGGVVTRRSASDWVPDLVAAAGPRATDASLCA